MELTDWKDIIPENIRNDMGGRLRVFREDADISIEQLSKMTGWDISKMETTGNISESNAKKFGEIFNIDYRIFIKEEV